MNSSCKKASEMIEKQELFGLSFFERMKLNIHLKMCNACKNYKNQSVLIDSYLKHSNAPVQKLTDEQKKAILKKCEEQ